MSNTLYIGSGASSEERRTWVLAIVTLAVCGYYLVTVLGQARDVPVSEIAYEGSLITTIAISIGLQILLSLIAALVSPRDADKTDERDTDIHRFGEYFASYVLWGGSTAAMGLALAKFEHFWIANALFATFVVATLTSSVVKLVGYRRGI